MADGICKITVAITEIENEVQSRVKGRGIDRFSHARLLAWAVRVPFVWSRRFQIADTSQLQS